MAEFTFVERKPMDGREHKLDTDATVGREGCDIVLADPEVSRRHAALRITGDGASVEDFGSTNGTFVNDERVSGTRPLSDGDVVRFGNTEWELRGTNAAAGGVAAPQVTAARPVPTCAASRPSRPSRLRRPSQPQPAASAGGGAPAAVAEPPTAAQPVAPSATGAAATCPRRRTSPPRRSGARCRSPRCPRRRRSLRSERRPRRGSAATRGGYTAFCFALFIATIIGVVIYFITV